MGAFIHALHDSEAPFDPITYPQKLERCEACHLAGTFNTARASALPLTVDPGADLFAWQDDLADSATAGTCQGCHSAPTDRSHMSVEGGTFNRSKQLTPSSSEEGCATCHGPGQVLDTRTMHCSLLPYGQCSP
jgi:OmcA/MtrC family decaheme c-type cytochrome